MRTLNGVENDRLGGCRDGFSLISRFRPRFSHDLSRNWKKIVGSTYARKNVSRGDGNFYRKNEKIFSAYVPRDA